MIMIRAVPRHRGDASPAPPLGPAPNHRRRRQGEGADLYGKVSKLQGWWGGLPPLPLGLFSDDQESRGREGGLGSCPPPTPPTHPFSSHTSLGRRQLDAPSDSPASLLHVFPVFFPAGRMRRHGAKSSQYFHWRFLRLRVNTVADVFDRALRVSFVSLIKPLPPSTHGAIWESKLAFYHSTA